MARDWDKELAKIDKRISTISDAELMAGSPAAGTPVIEPNVARGAATPTTGSVAPAAAWSMYLRAGLTTALAVGVPFWPYAARCGLGLGAYLASVTVVIAAGGWTAWATWRSRMGRIHVLALTIIAWGLALAAIEVLPRVGYRTDAARATWFCN